MSKGQWWFLGGMVAGALAVILLCVAAMSGGVFTYLLFARPSVDSTLNTADTVEIDAREGWQSTDVWVTEGMRVTIEVIAGEWTNWRGTTPYNLGEGGAYICARAIPASQCVEPLPYFPAGGLIGQIGGQTFGVGQNATLVAEQSGRLQLRINDADHGLYDNDGELTVEIRAE